MEIKNMSLKLKDAAPDFTMKISEEKTITLSELKDKNVVLYFYPKDNTPGCTLEAKDFNSHKKEFDALNAVIIGVSKDKLTAHDKFKCNYNLGFDLASDFENDTCEKYGVWAQKSMFGKKYMGINRTTFLINTEGKIAHVWEKVGVFGHAKEVLKVIKELNKEN
jgi:peroxiredoxin Q/BCP